MILIDKRVVVVKELTLDAYIYGSTDSKIEKKYLNNFPKRFKMTILNSLLEIQFPIDSFSILILSQGKFVYSGKYSNNENLGDLYILLHSLESGDELFFFDIYYSTLDLIHKQEFSKYTII